MAKMTEITSARTKLFVTHFPSYSISHDSRTRHQICVENQAQGSQRREENSKARLEILLSTIESDERPQNLTLISRLKIVQLVIYNLNEYQRTKRYNWIGILSISLLNYDKLPNED